jgi:hypothetical protein
LLSFLVACGLGFFMSLFLGGEGRRGTKERNEGVMQEEVGKS